MEEQKTVPYGMTLRELLRSCSFDDIAEEVRKDEHQAECVDAYKMAYDILLNMEGNKEETYDIEVTLYKGWDADESKPLLRAKCLEWNRWEEFIDGDIYTIDTVPFTKEQLAFRILWHLTYYGFSPEEQKETWQRMCNNTGYGTEYGIRAAQIERNCDMVLANDRVREKIIESVKFEKEMFGEECENYALGESEWGYIHFRRKHCNRMKRMRDHRWRMYAKKLWKLDEETYYENKRKKKENETGN